MNEHNTVSGVAARFTKKPVTIEAIQWTGRNLREIIAFTNGPPDTRTTHAGMAWDAYVDLVARDGLMIYTLEDGPDRRAKHFADIGDWIIRGVKGEYYPCKPDIFEATYSRAALAPADSVLEDAEPDMFWDADNREIFAYDIEEIVSEYDPGQIVSIECAQRLPSFRVLVTVDEDGNSYEYLDAAIAAGRARLEGKP